MKSRLPSRSSNPPPSLEALLGEKDARIAELTADKEHLYHLLAEAQASLAREQALRSLPPSQTTTIQPAHMPVSVLPDLPAELTGGVAPFRFTTDEGKTASEPPVKAALGPMPDVPEEVTAVMELFQFVAADGETPPPPVSVPAAASEAPAKTELPAVTRHSKEKPKLKWQRWFGKIMD